MASPKASPPSFYSKAGEMAGNAPPSPAGGAPGQGKDAAQGEKVELVATLLKVLEKWRGMEKDQKGLAIIEKMADMAKEYSSTVLGKDPGALGGGDSMDKPAATPPVGGAAPGGAPAGDTMPVPA